MLMAPLRNRVNVNLLAVVAVVNYRKVPELVKSLW